MDILTRHIDIMYRDYKFTSWPYLSSRDSLTELISQMRESIKLIQTEPFLSIINKIPPGFKL